MKVSIIIPCFRQGRFLVEAIDSCLAQTYRPIEIIVVNDGSDDNTDEVALGYKDAIVYVRKENGGVSTARNAGIAAASGHYMKFLDADDHLAPEQVAWQMETLAGRQDHVSLTTIRAYENGHPERFRDMVPKFRTLMPDLLWLEDGAMHSCLYPAKLVRTVGGFDPRYINTQDWRFICQVGFLRPELHCDPRVGGYYRLHPGSLSTLRRLFTIETGLQLVEMHDQFRDGPNRDWFGPELLAAEQATFRRMIVGNHREPKLEQELLSRILELWPKVGPPRGLSSKFLLLRRVLGYRLAEHVYARYARWQFRRRRESQGIRSQ